MSPISKIDFESVRKTGRFSEIVDIRMRGQDETKGNWTLSRRRIEYLKKFS